VGGHAGWVDFILPEDPFRLPQGTELKEKEARRGEGRKESCPKNFHQQGGFKMKMSKAKWLLFLVLMVSLVLAFSGISPAADPNPQKVSAVLKAGGGTVGGVGYVMMTGMSKVVKDAYPRLDITVVPGGWVGNIPRVDKGELDLAHTTIAAASMAKLVKPPFDQFPKNVKSLFATQEKLYYMAFVRKDFPVDTLEDIFKKKIPARLCTLALGNLTELMWRQFFLHHNTTWEDVSSKLGGKMNFVTWGDAVNLVKDGHADGILAVGTKQIGWALDLTNSRPMKILKFTQADLDYMSKTFGFGKDDIPANTYTGINKEVICPTDSGMAIVNSHIEDQLVEAILAALWKGAGQYAKYHAALANFKPEGMCKGMPLPLHKAAEKFYKEKGCLK
jgi:TRAP transporter TAXI family solute receptor